MELCLYIKVCSGYKNETFWKFNYFTWDEAEASSLDQINMTEFRLEHDQIFFTPMNINIRTWPKNSQWRTLPLNMTKNIYLKYIIIFSMANLNVLFDQTMTTNTLRLVVGITYINIFIFWSCSPLLMFVVNFLVIFIRSSWIGQVNIPHEVLSWVLVNSYTFYS